MSQDVGKKYLGRIRVLVAPLDWGLGHTTRCIPIIKELHSQGSEVWAAGDFTQEIILKQEFPDLPFIYLPGYRIKYSNLSWGLLWKMILQVPKILRIISGENLWLKKQVRQTGFDAVISDNRFGLYHENIPCIFITHQLTIKSFMGFRTERILQTRNYNFINRYTECWIPDEEGDNNFAGELSHPRKIPSIPVYYTGILSRFSKKNIAENKNLLLIILSGPEPQRTVLENKILYQIKDVTTQIIFVRGVPGEKKILPSNPQVDFFNHISATDLNDLIQEASFIIGRCGYSTIMDLVKLKKKSILIPTPGQTEQEYLAGYLMNKKIALCINQDKFSLSSALEQAKNFIYNFQDINENDLLNKNVSRFLNTIVMIHKET